MFWKEIEIMCHLLKQENKQISPQNIHALGLHKVKTFNVDNPVRGCAWILHDHTLNTKLAEGDLIPTDGVNHKPCLLKL